MTPEIVLIRMGNTALMAIMKMVGPSPSPNQMMERGTQAMMGTCRIEFT